MQKLTKGVELIARERDEQIHKHGKTIAGDVKKNAYGKLLKAAEVLIDPEHNDEGDWPLNARHYKKIVDKSWIERLAIAGAFIAAEIDRLDSIGEK